MIRSRPVGDNIGEARPAMYWRIAGPRYAQSRIYICGGALADLRNAESSKLIAPIDRYKPIPEAPYCLPSMAAMGNGKGDASHRPARSASDRRRLG